MPDAPRKPTPSSLLPPPGHPKRKRNEEKRRAARRSSDLTPPNSVDTERGTVVITGICGRLGRRLARQLHRERHVIGVDRRDFLDRPKDIEHFQIDVRRKKTQDIFRHGEVAALVHLGVMHNPRGSDEDHHTWNVAGFQKLLDYVGQYNVPKVVLLSSANVYGPRPENAHFLKEDAPLLAAGKFSEMRDLVELDMLAQSFFWKRPETETVILRPTHILGTVKNAPSNYLRLKVVPRLMGFDPMVQVVHQDDVVRAIRLALQPGVRGIFNVAGPKPLALSEALTSLGRATVPVPHPLAERGLARMWRWRMTSFPAPELDFIRYVCMVDDTRSREVLGYEHKYDIQQTLSAVDDERWV